MSENFFEITFKDGDKLFVDKTANKLGLANHVVLSELKRKALRDGKYLEVVSVND